MVKNTKRAERRHHYARLKNNRRRNRYWSGMGSLKQAHLGMAVDTPCVCSCAMCGNPRRHRGTRTLAERRNDEALGSDLAALSESVE